MKQTFRKLTSMLLSVVMALSLMVTPTMAAETKDPPTEVKCEYTSGMPNTLTLTMDDSTWLAAVAAKHATLEVNNMTYTYKDNFGMFCSDNYWHVNGNKIEFVVTSPYSFFPAVFTLSADGYKDVKITVSKTGNYPNESVSATAEIVGGSGSTEKPDTPEKNINVSDVKFASSPSGYDWYVTFGTESDKSDNYINAITGVTVNGDTWTESNGTPSTGGKYCKYNYSSFTNHTKTLVLAFAQKNFGSTAVLKSGDIITITAEGYNDLKFKLVIDQKGNATVSADTTPGDIYQLLVKIVGSFESAIVGQEKYDGVTSATTGGASGNKNSSVTVYGALVEQGTEPADADWEELDHQSEIDLEGSKCSVSIVPIPKRERLKVPTAA